MLENLTFTEWVMIISIILTLISIIIHLCVLHALRKAAPQSISEKIKTGLTGAADTVTKILKTLNIEGVGDAVNLVKELVTKPSEEKKVVSNEDESATNS